MEVNNFPMYKTSFVDELIPYARNSRTHSDAQISKIAASIKEFGFLNPVIIDGDNGIVAGHGRVMAAKKLGMDEVPVIEASHLTEAQRRAYVIADNRLALDAEWDDEMLRVEFEELEALGFDLELTGFEMEEIKQLDGLDDANANSGDSYTSKILTPQYEPTGDKPDITELYDDIKAMDLIVSIQGSSLPEKERQFLMAAASRHIVFDYAKIANFYAHSSPECQDFMEKSALVIIDYDKAIENGFVMLSSTIDQIAEFDEDEE
jgi:hypothetical protein